MGERSVRPGAVGAEVEHVQRHARPGRPQPQSCEAVRRAQQALVRVARVGVGDHDVGVEFGAVLEAHPTARPDSTRICSTAAPHSISAAQPLQQRAERVDDRGGAADGVVHAPAPLELDDQGVQRGSARRMAADQQRMERKGLSQERIADAAVDEPLHAERRAMPEQEGQHPQHHVQLHHRPLGVRIEGVEDPAHATAEPDVAALVRGAALGDLLLHPRGVGVEVEVRSVLVERAVERVERHELHVVLESLPASANSSSNMNGAVITVGPRRSGTRPARRGRGTPADAILLLDHDHFRAPPRPGGWPQPGPRSRCR